MTCSIIKARSIIGKTIAFTNVNYKDLDFIFKLRSDAEKTKYLNPISPDINDQIKWLNDYNFRSNDAYFIIWFENKKIGTVRIYNPIEKSFSWGSWILTNTSPSHAAIESCLMIYKYALFYLGFESSFFDVRIRNNKVINFHKRFGATEISRNNENVYLQIDNDKILNSLSKYNKYLNTNLIVNYE